ncbi:MAG TPA: TlpA disulfide reductase family protein [Gelidibacter sp.]|uniref:TlpA family protein disulfide reductase n=1 Tax=Gelidibacter sp. TaxID=2018083 RepID=UPI002C0A1FD9|nr:TlpA disulfide reductase family protein [Gelidibacter sp.]HXJ99826.1 TlpA disulfide reductase family protein [Gelidibacter sp.]
MRYINLLIFILFFLFSCTKKNSENKNEVIISGQATSDYINKPIYLKYIINDSVITKVDTVSSNKKFKFLVLEKEFPLKAFITNDLTNHAPKVKELYQLSSLIYFQFGSPSVPLQFGYPKDIKLFLIEKGNISIVIQDSIYNSNISNSKLNDDLKALYNSLNTVMVKSNKFNSINFNEIDNNKVFDSLMIISNKISLEKTNVLDSFIHQNKNSFSSVYAFNIKPTIQKEDLKIFNQIDPAIRNNKLSEAGRIKLERILNTTNVDDTIKNFTLQDQNGNRVSLSDVRAKYILIDFWASWCAPCRKENAEISKYYSDFNTTNFQIVGISVDRDKDKWLDALKNDNTQWISLIDSKLEVNDRLGVIAYPTNFLIDSNYKIIDKNLNSEKLKSRLTELLE